MASKFQVQQHTVKTHCCTPEDCARMTAIQQNTRFTMYSLSSVLLFCLLGFGNAFLSPWLPLRPSSHPCSNALQSTNKGTEEPINGDSVPYQRTVNERTGYSTDSEYSQFLTRREQNNRKRQELLNEQNEDGYELVMQKSLLKRMLKFPLVLAGKALPKKPVEPGTLILVRHGESTWNANKTFTGWADADLSEQGVREVEHAARLLLEGGYQIDIVFTSRLKRAIKSVWILLQEMNGVFIPVFKSWRLNERMYGALTGLSKKETADLLGQELVQSW